MTLAVTQMMTPLHSSLSRQLTPKSPGTTGSMNHEQGALDTRRGKETTHLDISGNRVHWPLADTPLDIGKV